MTYALTEVEAMARKAARGAAYSWGMAEEAASATRWLCAAGLDGCAALARALEAADKSTPASMAPLTFDGKWQAEGGEICPLMAGAALSDSANALKSTEIRMKNVVAPILLLPFAAWAARTLNTAVTLGWAGGVVITNGAEYSLKAANDAALIDTTALVTFRLGGTLAQPRPRQRRAHPTPAAWAVLSGLALRTYAPASDESRLKGAGAGGPDND